MKTNQRYDREIQAANDRDTKELLQAGAAWLVIVISFGVALIAAHMIATAIGL